MSGTFDTSLTAKEHQLVEKAKQYFMNVNNKKL